MDTSARLLRVLPGNHVVIGAQSLKRRVVELDGWDEAERAGLERELQFFLAALNYDPDVLAIGRPGLGSLHVPRVADLLAVVTNDDVAGLQPEARGLAVGLDLSDLQAGRFQLLLQTLEVDLVAVFAACVLLGVAAVADGLATENLFYSW